MVLLELGLVCAVLGYFLPWMPVKILAAAFFFWAVLLQLLVAYSKAFLKISCEETLVRTFAREKTSIILTIKNAGWLPVDLVWADSTGELEVFGSTRGILTLGARKGTVISYQVRSPVRGLFSLGPAILRIRDPLGLFPTQIESPGHREILVYPPWETRFPAREGIAGGLRRNPWGLEPDRNRIKDIRPFTSGDSLRNLDRGASARLGRLLVRDFFASLDRPVLLVLDMNLESYPVRGRYQAMESALEAASRGVYRTFLAMEKAGLVIWGKDGGSAVFTPQWGREHTMAMLETLACAKPRAGKPVWAEEEIFFRGLSTSCSLVYLGPPPTGEGRDFLHAYYKRGHRVDLLLTGADESLEFPPGIRWGWIEDLHG